MTYEACATWTPTADLKKRLGSSEKLLLRKVTRIPWIDKVSNGEVLARAGVQSLFRKSEWFHLMRFLRYVLWKMGLENLALTGQIEEIRRKRLLWRNSLA